MTRPSESELSLPRTRAASSIAAVVVHRRGAVVTRAVDETDVAPSGPFELVVGGITPLADPGSFRATVPADGPRLVSIDSRVHIPKDDHGPGPTLRALEDLERQLRTVSTRYQSLEGRAERLRAFEAVPTDRKALEKLGPAGRVEAALTLNAVALESLSRVETRIVDLLAEQERLLREQSRLQLEYRHSSTEQSGGASRPTREVVLRFEGGSAGTLEGLEITYVVPEAARWWPTYSLRLTNGGRDAALTIEAVVAQSTDEDWTDVRIGLATSEIVFDASLPKLPSLRLGKKQEEPRTGFREPPAGVESLFARYDAFRGTTPAPPMGHAAMFGRGSAGAEVYADAEPPEMMDEIWEKEEAWEEEDDTSEVSRSYAAAEVAAPAPARAMSMQAPKAKKGAAPRFGGGGGPAGPPPEPPSFDPGEEWLMFEVLVMANVDSARRGKLVRRDDSPGAGGAGVYEAQQAAARQQLVDPAISRGMFDYQYDAAGTARIPSDGRLHRFELRSASTASRLAWRTTPLVDPRVFREAELDNPFDSPLLAGPVDVFSEGQLVTTTQVDRIDRGGSMRVGLGVDERIRVARNVRMNEESGGLLGGKRELIHDVEIELRSGLSNEANVEVLDRVAVSGDDTVSVELQRCEPRGESYTQEKQGAPVRGGRRWLVALPAGGTSTIEYRYQITLRSKDEIVGGNRRG